MTVEIEPLRYYLTIESESPHLQEVYQAVIKADAESDTGKLTAADIRPHLSNDHPEQELAHRLDVLRQYGYIVEGRDPEDADGPERWFEMRERNSIRIIIRK